MFFSIIIPVYNAERSLEKCLNSLCGQTFNDFEVVLVDDGSEDESFAICKSFSQRDLRFKPVHQKNRGPSAARNAGMRLAEGQYFCFVDSDDYVSPDYLDQLYRSIKTSDADVVFMGYYSVNHRGDIKDSFLPPTGLSGNALLAALSEGDLFGYTWIKCFSKKALEGVSFPENMSLFEDEVFTCAVLEKTERVSVLPQPLYCYVNSGEEMLTKRTHEDFCTLSDMVYSAWEKLIRPSTDQDAFLQKKANTFVRRCQYYGFERDVNCTAFFQDLSKTQFFRVHTCWSFLDNQIKHENWAVIKLARMFYRLKQGLARI